MSTLRHINKKSRFIIITDLHWWHKNIANRKNYVKECAHNYVEIQKLILKEKETMKQDEKIYLVFLGDVFHRGIPITKKYNDWVQLITMLRALVNGIFAVVGNHELNFRDDNPFWSLTNEIESKELSVRGIQAVGALPIITITDQIEVFNFRLCFNHFGTPIGELQSENNFLFSHDYWSTKEIINQLSKEIDDSTMKKYAKGKQIDDKSILRFFDHCFFGHNHLLYGTYQIAWDSPIYTDTILHYLGSIGLTKRQEVTKTAKDRIIPVLTFTGENEYSIREEKIPLLQSNEEVLNLESIAEIEEKQEQHAEMMQQLEQQIILNDDPVNKLRDKYRGIPDMLSTFDALLEGGIPTWITKSTQY